MTLPVTTSLQTTAQLSPERRAWLLGELRWPVLATIGADGRPSQSVVWFDLDPDDDVVLLNTLAGRVKHRHLQRDPRASLCFEDGFQYVTIEGRAELDQDPERGLEGIWALARRYGEGEGSFAPGHRVNIRIRIERVIWHP